MEKARQLASYVSLDDYGRETNAHVSWLWERARNALKLDWPAVKALAEILLEEKTIGYRKTKEVIATALEERDRELGKEVYGHDP